MHDVVIQKVNVVRVEGRLAKEQLVHNDTQTKVVSGWSHSLPLQHLRRQVGWAAAESLRHVVLGLFTEAKIDQQHVSICPNHHILRLQVAVDDAKLVEALQSQQYFGDVKASVGLTERSFLS